MGATKDYELQKCEEEQDLLDREFERARPDLVCLGWDRETWEAFQESLDDDD